MKPLILETSRLLLRPHKLEDRTRIDEYAGDPEFSQYEPWGPNTPQDTINYINEKVAEAHGLHRFRFDFALELKESGSFVGGAGIRRESQESAIANLGWGIHPAHQNQGLASEAASELIRFSFDVLKVSVIYATCDARNVASYHVMEKCGMKRVGILVRDKEIKNQWRDTLRYEILRLTKPS